MNLLIKETNYLYLTTKNIDSIIKNKTTALYSILLRYK